MKKLLFIFAVLALVSCKDSAKEKDTTEIIQNEKETGVDIQLLRGEFIYLADAAVLNCGTKIYGVDIDEKMHELAKLVAEKKTSDLDMVPVIIKGVIHPKDTEEEGWEEIVTIKEIVKVLEPVEESAIKIESGK